MRDDDDDFEADSDPLPFTQVHRSAKNKAAMLSGIAGVTFQHALGSLVCFWDLNGDAREIEALIAAGKNEVVLTKEQVAQRILLACGGHIEPAHFVTVGMLERRGEDFRVRGMSRFFEPVRGRMAARESARQAGLASAAARRAKNGTAQPNGRGRKRRKSNENRTESLFRSEAVREPFEERSAGRSADVQQPSNGGSNAPEPIGERREERADTSEEKDLPPAASRQQVLAAALIAIFAEKRQGEKREGAKYKPSTADWTALARLMKFASDEEITSRWRVGLDGQFDQKVNTIAQLDSKWNALTAPTEPASNAARTKPNAPVRAETQKFTKTGDVTERFYP